MKSRLGNTLVGTCNKAVFDAIQARPAQLAYDYVTRVAHLRVAGDDCVDMDGTIAYLEHLDPDVEVIHAYNNQGRDTSYTKHAGHWRLT